MRTSLWVGALLVGWGCGDGYDEFTCEVEVESVTICIDVNTRSTCEDWGGVATPSELQPGGPYVYCEDLFAEDCNVSAQPITDVNGVSSSFFAQTEADCIAAAGATLGG